jgi:hypothetical protein
MSDCATQKKIRFETPASLALEAAFDGGRLTSDGGLTWLAEVDGENTYGTPFHEPSKAFMNNSG